MATEPAVSVTTLGRALRLRSTTDKALWVNAVRRREATTRPAKREGPESIDSDPSPHPGPDPGQLSCRDLMYRFWFVVWTTQATSSDTKQHDPDGDSERALDGRCQKIHGRERGVNP
jgi:hypothetical protein